ncbi:MAG: nodulation protein NfeD [Proteobacteria bacterium]|nr:nodulation protein NfeD [Pseudomonadota bacterium]
MKKNASCLRVVLFLALVCAGLPVLAGEAPLPGPLVLRMAVDGPVSPVSADYIEKGLESAMEREASLLVIQLDTPGGLMTSTRQIVKALLGARIPVSVYVAPAGARAASAGVFLTMASHVAAMAPGTNIGAAHPVNIGGGNPFSPRKEEEEKKGETTEPGKGDEEEKEESPGASGTEGKESPGEGGSEKRSLGDQTIMAEKVINDTVAFARSIAQERGRNADWAERAVRESVSVTEREALELSVIDIIARTTEDLIEQAHGRTVKISGEDVVLDVAGARIEEFPMGWRHRLLMAVSDPNIAYILMMLGIYGLFFELSNPGVILPGVLGTIFLILAFFSFQVLPINYAGLLLILLALVLFILEVKVVSYGMLSVGGAVSLFLGSIMLFESVEPYYRLSLKLVISMTGLTVLFFVVVLGFAVRAQRRKPTTGMEGLIGESGVVTVPLTPEGKVRVHGEIWSAAADGTIPEGTRVLVSGHEGMMLKVKREGEG